VKKPPNLGQVQHCARYSSCHATVFKPWILQISAAAPGISTWGASCIPSGIPRMPIGGTSWICAEIITWIAGLFGAWGFAVPVGLFRAWGFTAPAGLFRPWGFAVGAGLFRPWGFAAPAGLFGAWRFVAVAGLFGAHRFTAPAGLFRAWTFAGACLTRTGVPGINIGRARWFIAEIFTAGRRYFCPKGRTFQARGFAGAGGGGLFWPWRFAGPAGGGLFSAWGFASPGGLFWAWGIPWPGGGGLFYPWGFSWGECCIFSGVLRMPLGGAAWICAGIITKPGPLFWAWGMAGPGGGGLFCAWGFAGGADTF